MGLVTCLRVLLEDKQRDMAAVLHCLYEGRACRKTAIVGIDIGKSASVAEVVRLVQRPITVISFTDQ